VRPNQAGHSIAEEARQLKASALVMGLRYRNGAPLYGKTLQTVLAERPTRVIVVGEPQAVTRPPHLEREAEPRAVVQGGRL
jgi:APA family basic amino acid/polyamine antiporter